MLLGHLTLLDGRDGLVLKGSLGGDNEGAFGSDIRIIGEEPLDVGVCEDLCVSVRVRF